MFWILFFVVAHLWNFRTAPWNGDGIFDDAAVDLLFLKTHVISRPFQAAWFYSYGFRMRDETLFHYYLWPWLHLFGYNILTNEAALLALWCTTFLFTLLLTDLFFRILHCHICHCTGFHFSPVRVHLYVRRVPLRNGRPLMRGLPLFSACRLQN